MRITVAIGLALALAANGLLMLLDPAGWYALAPGVPETGPLNLHFVRDIGCAYILAGLALAGLAFNERAWSAALIGALFLTLHALVHVADGFSGRVHANHVLADFVAVYAPAAIALWLVLFSTPISGSMPMLTWLIKWRIDAFERVYGYDTSYLRDMLAADVKAVMALWKVQGLSQYRKGVPREAWYAAGLAGVLSEDCGPCTQLGIAMAERDGVAADTLRAIVAGDTRMMPDEVVLAYRFAKASLARDAAADELRIEIMKRWGQQGLISLAFALASARIFPTIKYALGHGQACSRVTVAGTPVPVLKRAA